jgi:hypothetical protein
VPCATLKKNEVTCGPFPIKRDYYEYLQSELPKGGARTVYYALLKVEFEKTGATAGVLGVRHDLESIQRLTGLMSTFDIEHPHVRDFLVWICPTDQCRLVIGHLLGRVFRPNDFSWWNAVLPLAPTFDTELLPGTADRMSLLPTFLSVWSTYMPHWIELAVFHLYAEFTRGGKFSPLSRTQAVSVIRTAWRNEDPIGKSDADREVLIKELCESSGVTYPTDAESSFEYLAQIGIVVQKEGVPGTYTLAQEPPNLERILRIPPGWRKRAAAYVRSGSVLFSYLRPEETLDTEV